MGAVGTLVSGVGKILGKRGKELFDRIPNLIEALGVVNPNYDTYWNVSQPLDKSAGSDWDKWGRNCALCSVAGALQLMGYDVGAMPRDPDKWRGSNSVFEVDYSSDNVLVPRDNTYWPTTSNPNDDKDYTNWKQMVKNPNKVGTTVNKVTNQIDKFMQKAGAYSYAELTVAWKKGGAHSMIVYRDKYHTYLMDFQTHQMWVDKEDIQTRLAHIKPQKTQLIRLDNAKMRTDISESELAKMVKRR